MDRRSAADDLAELSVELYDEEGLTDTLQRLLEYVLDALDCDGAGAVFVRGRGRFESAGATSPRIAALDLVGADCGQGPVLEALAERVVVQVGDALTEERWPHWAAEAADRGMRSMLCIPMLTEREVLGTLNLYSASPDRFDDDDRAVGEILCRHATVALGSARHVENLYRAIDARKLIGQAQGILMERYGLNADRAFAVLLRYSQHLNLKLRAVAELLVSTGRLPE